MQEDSTDSRLRASGNSFQPLNAGVAQAPTASEFTDPQLAYPVVDASKIGARGFRGHCLLINQHEFHPSTGQGKRDGTDTDADCLERVFKQLRYKVQRYLNVDRSNLTRILRKVAETDHSGCDSFVCCVLSHGEDGVVYAYDGAVPLEMIIGSFRGPSAPSLAGKPKFFIIQACRGIKFDKGIPLVTDNASEIPITKIPVEADILVAYSTVPGYYAWRNSSNGSWFIQELCRVLEEDGKRSHSHDVATLLTLIARCVAFKYRSNTGMEGSHNMLQMTNFTSTLTRLMYVTRKIA